MKRISTLINHLILDLSPDLDIISIENKLWRNLPSEKISVRELLNLLSEIVVSLSIINTDYSILAGRIRIRAIYSETVDNFKDYIEVIKSVIQLSLYDALQQNIHILNQFVVQDNDYLYNYLSVCTLENNYLLRNAKRKIVERPQYMWMRVSCAIHIDDLLKNNINSTLETYNAMSLGLFVHASPTLFNAGLSKAQMASCFLLAGTTNEITVGVTTNPTIRSTINNIGFMKVREDCEKIGNLAGGIGIAAHDMGQNMFLNWMHSLNHTSLSCQENANKRPGAINIYLETWHISILEFINMRRNIGENEKRVRELFTSLWISDLFMRRVESNDKWTLLCPNTYPGLSDVYGDEFEKLYTKYESADSSNNIDEDCYRRVVRARDIWIEILRAQMETGMPFILYKDRANALSNHNHLGTIRCSNLCTEIIEYSSATETAVCNLASIALNKFVDYEKPDNFDYGLFEQVIRIIVRNLNCIIEHNYYPIQETRNSNMKHRPIGIGVQGMADMYHLMRIPFESKSAADLNRKIFEYLYYTALDESANLAEKHGTYESYLGSPLSRGILHIDHWPNIVTTLPWKILRKKIKIFGVRNSLLVTVMPTVSTSQILGNNESIEPYGTNIYLKRTSSGEYIYMNVHLMKRLRELGLWNEKIREELIKNFGSIQNIADIPINVRKEFKTIWEIRQKILLDRAIDRAPFIDHSQSINIYMNETTMNLLSSMHYYGWRGGLKTGMYYLRTKPAAHALRITLIGNNTDNDDTNESEF